MSAPAHSAVRAEGRDDQWGRLLVLRSDRRRGRWKTELIPGSREDNWFDTVTTGMTRGGRRVRLQVCTRRTAGRQARGGSGENHGTERDV